VTFMAGCGRCAPPRSAFAGFRSPVEVIVPAVRWYLRYGAPHLVALVRNGAVFKKGKLVERSTARGLIETAA